MLKAIETLLSDTSGRRIVSIGNHSVMHCENVDNYYYFWTPICVVNTKEKTFKVDNGGFDTKSTTRAINDYRKYFKNTLGYREIKED